MILLLTTLLSSTAAPAAPAAEPAAAPAAVVYKLGPRAGALRFQAFSRLTDPFGDFGAWYGRVTVPGGDLSRAQIEVTVEIATINTNNAKRDAHLNNADFFNQPKWPKAVFTASGMKAAGGDKFRVSGTLEMMGKKVPVSFPATVKIGGDGRLSIKADFRIDRTKWGMSGYQGSFSINPIQTGVRVLFDLKANS